MSSTCYWVVMKPRLFEVVAVVCCALMVVRSDVSPLMSNKSRLGRDWQLTNWLRLTPHSLYIHHPPGSRHRDHCWIKMAVGCNAVKLLTSGPDQDSGLDYCGTVRQQQAGRAGSSNRECFPFIWYSFKLASLTRCIVQSTGERPGSLAR